MDADSVDNAVNVSIQADDVPPGDLMDSAIPSDEPEDRSSVVPFRREARSNGRDQKPKSGPPSLDDWQDFLSRMILKTVTDAYVDMLFRDIDENSLSDREVSRLYLRDDERERIAKPVAELFNKLEFTRKHGRAIIAAAGSGESAWTVGLWFLRVRRIAYKHRSDVVLEGRVTDSGYPRQDQTAATGRSESRNGHKPPPPPNGGYTIIQPGTG